MPIPMVRVVVTDFDNLRFLICYSIFIELTFVLTCRTLHAGGNLLKVRVDGSDPPRYRLAYLDYGIVSYVPSQVRDGLVCAVAALVFAGDTAAVADLFGELQLIPQHVLDDPSERQALQDAMKITLAESLKYPDSTEKGETAVPVLLFDKLLDALSRLVPRFQFDLPPYFINNARQVFIVLICRRVSTTV